MTTTLYCVLKQARPTAHDLKQWWKLFHAADRNDPRTHGSVIRAISDQLVESDLTRAEKAFLLRAWRLLVDNNDAFARLLGGYEFWVDNAQDPALNYLELKPELVQQLDAGALTEVYAEAYQEARASLQENAAPSLDVELLETMKTYGWNVDRKSAPAVLNIILHRLKAFEDVAQMTKRYLLDPEAYAIDLAADIRRGDDE